MAYKSLGINRLDPEEDIKEKGIKKYGKEHMWKNCQEAKNEESGGKGVGYKNEKKERLRGNKKKDLGQNVCQAL